VDDGDYTGDNRDKCDHNWSCGEHGIQLPVDGDQLERLGFRNGKRNDANGDCGRPNGSGKLDQFGTDGGFRNANVGCSERSDRIHVAISSFRHLDVDNGNRSGDNRDECNDYWLGSEHIV